MTDENENARRPTILVVDDAQENLALMGDLLKGAYRVKVAISGEIALRIAHSDPPPDLILLDIMMPGIDGYEVCRRLKSDPSTLNIPIIFLTAKADEEDERLGLEMGAVDYITKPICPPIALARIHNHLELKKLNDHLATLVSQRTRELEEAYSRLQALDSGSQDYLRTIAHELRTPVHGVLGIGQLALDEIQDKELKEQYQYLFSRSSERLIAAIDSALQLANLQSGGLSIATRPINMTAIVRQCGIDLRESLSDRKLAFVLPPLGSLMALGDPEFLRQSVISLLKAAERLAIPDTAVTGNLDAEGGSMTLRIAFQTKGISDELQRSFFKTFSYDRSSSKIEELGLSLPLAFELMKAMGGSVKLDKSGSTAEFRLCLLEAAPA